MQNEVTIKIRAFPYYEDAVDPATGETRKVERVARRGDTVKLSDVDYERARRFDAIRTEAEVEAEADGEAEATPAEAAAFDIETASVEELSGWIQGKYTDGDKPIVDEVVAEGTGDPELAKRLLEAENHATGGQPRVGVVNGLTEIIEDADGGSSD